MFLPCSCSTSEKLVRKLNSWIYSSSLNLFFSLCDKWESFLSLCRTLWLCLRCPWTSNRISITVIPFTYFTQLCDFLYRWKRRFVAVAGCWLTFTTVGSWVMRPTSPDESDDWFRGRHCSHWRKRKLDSAEVSPIIFTRLVSLISRALRTRPPFVKLW